MWFEIDFLAAGCGRENFAKGHWSEKVWSVWSWWKLLNQRSKCTEVAMLNLSAKTKIKTIQKPSEWNNLKIQRHQWNLYGPNIRVKITIDY